MKYLIDTNVFIESFRRPKSNIAEKLNSVPVEDLATSAVVAGELLLGPYRQKSKSRESTQDILSLFLVMDVLPFNLRCAQKFAEIGATLLDAGIQIGDLDLQIAATALVHGLTVVTA